MNKLDISISSQICNILKIENFIEEFATYFQLSPELFAKINLSVIEAVNNAILSGNKQQLDKMVTVVAEKTLNQFKVTISDEGEGFDYTCIPNPTQLDNIYKSSGRGLYLMKTLSNELIFERNGSTVILIFDLGHKMNS